MLKIAVIDDEKVYRDEVQKQIKEILEQKKHPFQIDLYSTGEQFVVHAEKKGYDLAILDIYMEGMNGVETAEKLKKICPDTKVVFLTTSRDYAVEGFRLRAFHYLLKPLDNHAFSSMLEEFLSSVKKEERFIQCQSGNTQVSILVSAILYAEHYKHQIFIYLEKEKEIVTRMTFREFISLFEGEKNFFVPNRGTILNLEKVDQFDGQYFWMEDGKEIPVSRDKQAQAKSVFSEYLYRKLWED
ncbi:MAG: LytTR family DNA-binding domain-containing protein [Lachnospiraceae bacterium]|nr:LytTR family DNA-binding domain-containing protein [Lachnospiraceae bacterium]